MAFKKSKYPISKTFINRIKRYMVENETNQSQLAIKLGMSRQGINLLMLGRSNPSYQALLIINRRLGIDFEEMFPLITEEIEDV